MISDMKKRRGPAALLALLISISLISCAGSALPSPDAQTANTAVTATVSPTPEHSESAGTLSSPTAGESEAPTLPEPSETQDVTPAEPSTTPAPQPEKTVLTLRSFDLAAVSPLWRKTPAKAPDPVTVSEVRRTENGQKIQLAYADLALSRKALDAFEELNFRFAREYPGFSLILITAATEDADALRCAKTEREQADHALGYSVDLWYMTKSGGKNLSIQPWEAPEKTVFLKKEAAALGIVADSGANYAQRHFTYVGLPHSLYIYEKGVSVDEYLETLGDKTLDDPLRIAADDLLFSVFSVPAGEDETEIEVLKDVDYTVLSTGISYILVSSERTAPQPGQTTEPAPTTAVTTETPSPTPGDAPVIYVDAGHGFLSKSGVMDYGAGEGSFYFALSEETLGHGQYEADLDLQIALKVEKLLKERGFTVLMSRTDYAYERLPISDRAARVKNAGADLIVSIHANTAANDRACGARVYYNANESFSRYRESKAFAEDLSSRINSLCPAPTACYTVNGSDLAMLRGTGDVPSVLVETCFLTNEEDAKKALDETWQNNMAQAIADACAEAQYALAAQ